VFYQSRDGHVCEISGQWTSAPGTHLGWDLEWLKWDDLTATVGGNPGYATSLTSFIDAYGAHVTFIGSDQHVYQYWYDIGASKWQPVKDLGSGPALSWSPLTSFADDSGEYIFYAGCVSCDIFLEYPHVHQLSFISGLPWTDIDLTKAVHGPDVDLYITPLTAYSEGSLRHAFYVGEYDCHVHQNLGSFDQDLTPSLQCGDDNLP